MGEWVPFFELSGGVGDLSIHPNICKVCFAVFWLLLKYQSISEVSFSLFVRALRQRQEPLQASLWLGSTVLGWLEE
jgi:hypothetical protein